MLGRFLIYAANSLRTELDDIVQVCASLEHLLIITVFTHLIYLIDSGHYTVCSSVCAWLQLSSDSEESPVCRTSTSHNTCDEFDDNDFVGRCLCAHVCLV